MLDHLESLRRLLVVRLDNIGDMVMLTPALRALRTLLPQAHITLMCTKAGSQVAPMLPWVDDIAVHRPLWQDASGELAFDAKRERRFIAALRRGRFDAALIFTSFTQTPYPPAYACYLAGIPLRAGQARDFGGGVLSHWIKPLPDETHQVDRNLHLLEGLGVPLAGRRTELHIPADAALQAQRLLRAQRLPDAEFIAVVPGASCQARTYPVERMMEVIRLLQRRSALPIAVLGSAREEGVRAAADALRGIPGVAPMIGSTSVSEFAAVLTRARLVLANNSAALHIADAVGSPLLVLFSGSDRESQWRPRQVPAAVLRRPTDCSPCYSFKCPLQFECLDIPPHEVVERSLAMLTAASGDLRDISKETTNYAPDETRTTV